MCCSELAISVLGDALTSACASDSANVTENRVGAGGVVVVGLDRANPVGHGSSSAALRLRSSAWNEFKQVVFLSFSEQSLASFL